MLSAYGKHEFMYSNFRFVGMHIWKYLDVFNVTLPKFKNMIILNIILSSQLSVFLSVHKVLVFIPFIYYSFLLHFCFTLYIIYSLFVL